MTVDQFIIGFLVVLVTAAVFLVVLGVSMWVRDSIQERQERALFAAYSGPPVPRLAAMSPPLAHEEFGYLAAPTITSRAAGEDATAAREAPTSPARRALPVAPVAGRPWPGTADGPAATPPVAAGHQASSADPVAAALEGPGDAPGLESEASGPPVPAPVPDGFGATYAYVRAIQDLTTEDYLASLARRPWAEDTGAFTLSTTGWS